MSTSETLPVSELIDQWGLLDKKREPDGGDTCQREGMLYTLLGMTLKGMIRHEVYHWAQRFAFVMKKLHPHPGVLLRHCNPEYDSSDWDRMSRDQLQPMIIACGYWSKDELRKLSRGHLKRGFLFCNNVRQNGATKRNHGTGQYSYAWKFPDLTGPEIWGNFIRAHMAWYLWPLLLAFDVELLLGSIKWRWFAKHNIALNHTLSVMQAVDRMPTPVSWLATKIMPVPKLIEICADHLDDDYVEMPVFTDMFKEAWNIIGGKDDVTRGEQDRQ